MTLHQRLWPIFGILAGFSIVLGVWHVSKTIPVYWPAQAAKDAAAWAVGCGAAALFVRWLAPSHGRAALLAVVGAYLAIGGGLAECAAAALMFASCWCCGSLALQAAFPGEGRPAGLTKPLIVGLACELALFGVLIHLPVNGHTRYIALLLAPILAWAAVRRPRTDKILAGLSAKGDVLSDVPFWMFALAVGVVGFAARYAFLPAVDYDNNSEHLRLWTELGYRHRFSFDVLQQAWNVEPFAVDLLRAIPSLAANRDAQSPVGWGLLGLLLRQMWVIGDRLGLRATDRLLLLVLFVSTPMAGWLVFAMQAELFLAMLAATGVRLLLDSRAETGRGDATAMLAIAALCCATKLPGAVLGLFLLLASIPRLIEARRQGQRLVDLRRQWPILAFVLIFVATAFNSYFTAWRVTGNPLFPLYNGRFKSPYFPLQDFGDPRWIKGFDIQSLFGLFFHTSQFNESRDYTAGFQYLFLLPLGLLALPWRGRRTTAIAIALPLLGYGLAMFSQTQYLRYLFPILPLASLAIGALFVPGSWAATGAGAFRAFAGLCVGLNLFFYPGVSYLFETAPQLAYGPAGKARLTADLSPVKALVEELNAKSPNEPVLFPTDSPFGATLTAEPLYVNWYAPTRQARFAAIRTEADAGAFLAGEKARHVIWDMSDPSKPGEPGGLLHAYLIHNATPEAMSHNYVGYAVATAAPAYHPVFDLQQAIAANPSPLVLPPGSNALMPGAGLEARPDPLVIARVPTNWARIMRYRAQFQCATDSGYFIAQVNWDRGAPFYQLVKCGEGAVDFEEAFPIPEGASLGEVYVTARDTSVVTVSRLVLETN